MPSNHRTNISPNLYRRGTNNNSPGLVKSIQKMQKVLVKENLDLKEVINTQQHFNTATKNRNYDAQRQRYLSRPKRSNNIVPILGQFKQKIMFLPIANEEFKPQQFFVDKIEKYQPSVGSIENSGFSNSIIINAHSKNYNSS